MVEQVCHPSLIGILPFTTSNQFESYLNELKKILGLA